MRSRLSDYDVRGALRLVPAGNGRGPGRRRVERVGRFAVSPGHPGVTHFLLTQLLVPEGPRARLRRAVLPWVPAQVRESLLFEEPPEGAAAGSLPRELHERAVDFARAAGLRWARDAGWILLGDAAARDCMRLTMFLFPAGEARPAAVLKIRGANADGPSLAAEWDALVRVAQMDERLRGSVPAPIASRFAVDGQWLIQTALAGTSAYVALRSAPPRRRALETLFDAAAAWLAAFHGPARSHHRQLAACGHGDYRAHNILLTEGAGWPAVVGWEHFTTDAPRCLDLFHFPLGYVLLQPWIRVGRCSPVHAFRLGFLDPNPVSGAVRNYLERYCAETGVAPASLRELLHEYLQTRGLPVAGCERGDANVRQDLAAQCRELLEDTTEPGFLPPCAH
jgi:aminoglycoside phosphotransferase (APT) family kinase protein